MNTSSNSGALKRYFFVTIVLAGCAMKTFPANAATVGPIAFFNKTYSVTVNNDLSVLIRRNDGHHQARTIQPSLCVLYSAADPQFGTGQLADERTPAAGWKDGGKYFKTDVFKVAEKTELRALTVNAKGPQGVSFDFPANDKFMITLRIELVSGINEPVIQWRLKPKIPGWFSIGFTGVKSVAANDLDFLYLPLVWQWKRFPKTACLTPESYCTTAATYTTYAGANEGLAPDPAEIPYRYANYANSRFGLALRDEQGLAKPMLFAPILGGAGSKSQPGRSLSFKCRYFIKEGDWYLGFNEVIASVFNYHNERQNTTTSLNGTLQNMINYAMDDKYSGWVEELKGFNYSFDVPGTVKVVSALHPLSIALTTGNLEIYKRRALPLIEYVMSREKYLYATSDTIISQNPSHYLKGPCAEIGELAGLYSMTGGNSFAFKGEAERIFGKPRKLNLLTETTGSSWQDYLAKYRLTNDPAALQKAIAGADEGVGTEINNFPTGFENSAGLRDKKSAFYTDFLPRWNDYLELYETTRNPKYLNAAKVGARGLLYWLRSNPMAPDSLITVNKGGRVPGVFGGRRVTENKWEFFDTSTPVNERIVPAWQTSLVGINPEQPSTYTNAIMLASHAPWLLRLSALTKDPLLSTAAYNAVIGRYANFPGYYFSDLRTTVYQEADYPLHPYREMKYNAIFYNHVWPHIAMLQDFLVSDAYLRSGGNIDFPSVFSPGYAFLTSKVYGAKPGRIYGTDDVSLWLPAGALETNNQAFNYLFGVGKHDLFLALMNTSVSRIQPDIYLNPEKVPWNFNQKYPLVIYDKLGKQTTGVMVNGHLSVSLPASAIATIRIKGIALNIPLQHKRISAPGSSAQTYVRTDSGKAAIGTITGMLLNFTPDFSDAYIYVDASEKTTRKLKIQYRLGEEQWKEIEDKTYPFEFSIHLDDPAAKLVFKLEAEDRQGGIAQSKELILSNKSND
jgi:hypothetical protein